MGFASVLDISREDLLKGLRNGTVNPADLNVVQVTAVIQYAARGLKTTEEVFNQVESLRVYFPTMRWEIYIDKAYSNRPWVIWVNYEHFVSVEAFASTYGVFGPEYGLPRDSNIPEAKVR